MNILWEFKASESIPYDTLVERLKQRFSTQEQAEVYRAQLYRHKQLPGETLIDLLFDIRKLISLAYPNQQTTEVIEMMGRDIYIEALSDPDLALKVRERSPSSLNEAFDIASKLHFYKTMHSIEKNSYNPSLASNTSRNDLSEIIRRFDQAMTTQTQNQEMLYRSITNQLQQLKPHPNP